MHMHIRQVMMGAQQNNLSKWGRHYYRTLTRMLLAQRRSNFRDFALQHFGKDAEGREGLFEAISGDAEMKFASLKPPEPSLLNPPTPAFGVPVTSGAPPPPRTA